MDAGGGIFVNGDHDAHLELRDTASVSLNDAEHGGGIFCSTASAAEAVVDLGETAAVFFNRALLDEGSDGGGVMLRGAGCRLESRGGFLAGIFLNEAADQGGGLYVSGGATAVLRGGSNRAAILNDNVARQGGGAYVVDLGSNLDTVDAWVIGNLATEDGGAAFVRDGGLLEMSRTLGESCHDPVRCSRLALNHAGQAGSPGRGGAVFVDGEMGCGGDGEGDPCSLTGQALPEPTSKRTASRTTRIRAAAWALRRTTPSGMGTQFSLWGLRFSLAIATDGRFCSRATSC
jgi:hypothetical protein